MRSLSPAGTDLPSQIRVAIADRQNSIAQAAQRRPDDFERLIEFGTSYLGSSHPDGVTHQQSQGLIESVRKWLKPYHEQRSAAYMDSTTLYTIRSLLDRQTPVYPHLLLDLANFVNAAVLFDRVYCLPNWEAGSPWFFLNEMLDETGVFREITIDHLFDGPWDGIGSVGTVLTGIWKTARDHLEILWNPKHPVRPPSPEALKAFTGTPAATFATQVRRSWERLLKTPLPDQHLLFAEWESKWNSPAKDLLRDATSLLHAQPRTIGYDTPGRTAYELANECNQRSFFNLRVAQLLRLPYLPGWARAPFRNAIYERAQKAQSVLATADYLDAQYRERMSSYPSFRIRLQLPFLLTAALSKAQSVQDFCRTVAVMRAQAAGLRRHLTAYDAAVSEGNVIIMRDIRKALGEEQRRMCLTIGGVAKAAVVGGVIGVGAACLGMGEANSFGLAAIAADGAHGGAHYLAEGFLDRVQDRLVQPDRCYFTDLRLAADELGNALPRIEKLWGLPRHMGQVDYQNWWERIRSLRYA